MTYTFTKPDPGPSPALDASKIQTNFDQFAKKLSSTALGVIYNHMPMNNRYQGDHASVIFEKQTADLGVTGDLTVLYCKDASSKAGIQPQLFVQIPKFLPTSLDPTVTQNTPMQLTYNTVNTAGPNQYQSFIVGGYLLYFGTTTTMPDTITLSPVPTKILVAIGEAQNFSTGPNPVPLPIATKIDPLNNGKFTMVTSGPLPGSYKFSWVAIAQA